MSDTLLRHWAMLQHIPREPRKITASRIQSHLEDAGYRITLRSIQRDLEKLAIEIPLTCDTRDKPYGWSWLKNAKVFDIPGMDPQTAMSFHLVKTFLEPLIPRSSLHHLTPHFTQADNVLKNLKDNALTKWSSKIRIVPEGLPLIPPVVSNKILDAVYTGLLDEKCLLTKYSSRASNSTKELELNPLGLIYRDRIIYLIATAWDYQQVRLYALHRIKRAEIIEKSIVKPNGFCIDDYINEGTFNFPISNKTINLKVLFDKKTAFHLEETPLAKNQTLSTKKDGNILLEVKIQHTQQLLWWILSFGDKAEVLSPSTIRKEIKMIVKNLSKKYSH